MALLLLPTDINLLARQFLWVFNRIIRRLMDTLLPRPQDLQVRKMAIPRKTAMLPRRMAIVRRWWVTVRLIHMLEIQMQTVSDKAVDTIAAADLQTQALIERTHMAIKIHIPAIIMALVDMAGSGGSHTLLHLATL